jgi:hypothetical protein
MRFRIHSTSDTLVSYRVKVIFFLLSVVLFAISFVSLMKFLYDTSKCPSDVLDCSAIPTTNHTNFCTYYNCHSCLKVDGSHVTCYKTNKLSTKALISLIGVLYCAPCTFFSALWLVFSKRHEYDEI